MADKRDDDAAAPPAGARAAAVLAHCRAGFEGECAGEMQALAAAAGVGAWCVAERGSARVLCVPAVPAALPALAAALQPRRLVFARERVVTGPELPELPERRVESLVEAALASRQRFSDLRLETADSDLCRPLLPLCRKLAAPLGAALREAGLLAADDALPRLHVHLLASRRARLGTSLAGESSPWTMGIPRLRPPPGAPSRSALKLEEALAVLLPLEPALAPPGGGMQAVDLGAAPGGWSLVLARRGVLVTAVDNGPLRGAAAAHPGIEHLRADGFRYAPERPVDWLVCDMVESPSRIARLAGRWFAEGRCRAAVVNLKLPMKRRREEVERCRALLLETAARPLSLHLRQLYHDREEVTALATIAGL